MENTKSDLCFSQVKLDYQALIDTAKIAEHHCIEEISRKLDSIRRENLKPVAGCSIHMNAQWL